jgi:hypothetical protein
MEGDTWCRCWSRCWGVPVRRSLHLFKGGALYVEECGVWVYTIHQNSKISEDHPNVTGVSYTPLQDTPRRRHHHVRHPPGTSGPLPISKPTVH